MKALRTFFAFGLPGLLFEQGDVRLKRASESLSGLSVTPDWSADSSNDSDLTNTKDIVRL